MSHPPFFVSEPNLTPSDKKLGSAALKAIFRLFQATAALKGAKGA